MSRHILIVAGSAQGIESSSFEIAQEIADCFDQSSSQVRDLSNGLKSIDREWVTANLTEETARSPRHIDSLKLSDELIAELQWADIVIIATPIYNFSVPSALKAWIDHVCRAGKTFNYTEAGPKGLLANKQGILVITSGGVPVDSSVDFATPYLRQVLSFIGVTDVQTVSADQQLTTGDAMGRARLQVSRLRTTNSSEPTTNHE